MDNKNCLTAIEYERYKFFGCHNTCRDNTNCLDAIEYERVPSAAIIYGRCKFLLYDTDDASSSAAII